MKRTLSFVLVIGLLFGIVPITLAQSACPEGGSPAFMLQDADVSNDGTVVATFAAGQQVLRYEASPDGTMTQVCFNGQTGLVPTAVLSDQAPQAEGGFVLPVALSELPSTMASGMAYQTPSANCRDVVIVPNSCSTYEGQPTEGEVPLAGNTVDMLDERPEALAATGDVINVRWTPPQGYQGPVFEDEDGNTLVFPDIRKLTGTNTDVVVIANNSAGELPLYYDAAFGSFRGFFNLAITKPSWTSELIDNLVGLHSGYMMVQSDPAIAAWIEADPADEDGPYPQLNPRNCSTVQDIQANDQIVTFCDVVNVYRGVWNGTSWELVVGAYGVDRETGTGIWVDLTSVLPELAASAS